MAAKAPKFGSPEWRKLHPRKPKEETTKFVTVDRFNEFEERVAGLLEKALTPKAPEPLTPAQIAAMNAAQSGVSNMNTTFTSDGVAGNSYPPVESAEEKIIRKAGADNMPVNPEWSERAEEILGDALDHCEVKHLRSGGVIFTVVIKNEKSNESADYIRFYGSDRRSKEISSEGLEGVENWCKLIKSNLARPKPLSNRD